MYQYRKSVIRGSNHSKNSAEAREAQSRFEEAREKIQKFFRADNYHVIFTSGTTNSSNWIAERFDFRRGDMVLIPLMEHHSQMLTHKNLAGKNDIPFKFVPVTRPEGRLDLEASKNNQRMKRTRKNTDEPHPRIECIGSGEPGEKT
jgi:selenocysteine lyase/cysteine desulfurase